jgi:hypothetical protein
VSNSNNPKACASDSDCQGSQAGQLVTSKCQCGNNQWGQKFCLPFLGDLQGQGMIKSWASALKATSKCNTAHRSSDECLKSVNVFKNTTQATLIYYNFPLYQFNDDCVKVNLNDDYWFESGILINVGALIAVLMW